jgi:hypothetical protein
MATGVSPATGPPGRAGTVGARSSPGFDVVHLLFRLDLTRGPRRQYGLVGTTSAQRSGSSPAGLR